MSHAFKPGDKVTILVMNHQGCEGEITGKSTTPGFEHRWRVAYLDKHGCEVNESFHPDNLELIPEAPKFKPGDKVRIAWCHWPRNHGLEGVIAGRSTMPNCTHLWRVEFPNDAGVAIEEFHPDNLELIPSPAPEPLDRSYDEWPLREPTLGDFDGHANTSGLKVDPAILHDLGRDLHDLGRDDLADLLDTLRRRARSTVSVAEGLELWRVKDIAHRRVSAHFGGHTIEVFITVLPSLATHRIKFCSAYTAEEVIVALDEMAAFGAKVPDAEVTMARNPRYRFHEDTGDIEL
jgi:hypothetical protein